MEKSLVAQGLDENYQKAVALLTVPKFKEAFDLSKEGDRTRDRYGRTTYGQSCLLARRLAEAGAKFVNVYYSRSIGGTGNGWDYHGFRGEDVAARRGGTPCRSPTRRSRRCSRTWSSAGMLEQTLVVWVGEFGRTPKISGNGGRDHWPQCYVAVVAGGGTKPGFVYGASDKLGAYPTQGLARPEDLSATMFARPGARPGDGDPRQVQPAAADLRGKPLLDLFA